MGCLGHTGEDGRLSHWTTLWTLSLVKLSKCIQKKTNWEKKKKRGYRRREKRRFRRKNGRRKRRKRRKKKYNQKRKRRRKLRKKKGSLCLSQRLGFRSLGIKSGLLSWTGYWNSPQKPKTDGFLLRQNSPQWSYSNQKTSKKWKGRWPEIRKNWKIFQARTVKYSN